MLSSRARTLLAAGLGLGLFAALVAYAGPRSVLDAVLTASPLYLTLAVIAYALFFLARGMRWRTLLSRSAPDVRLASTTSATAVGWLANSFLPLKGGDVLRAALLAKREGLGSGPSIAIVALERVLDLVGLAIVSAIGLAFLSAYVDVPGWMQLAIELVWALPLLAIACLLVLVAMRERAMRLVSSMCRPLGRVGEKLHHFVDTAVAGVATLVKHPRLLLRLAPQTVVIAVLQTLVFTFLAMAFIPTLTPGLAFAGSSIFLLSFVISVTPGNVGTYEAAFGAVFAALGVPLAIGLPAAILTHVTTTLIVAVAGSAGLLMLGATGKPVARPMRVAGGPP